MTITFIGHGYVGLVTALVFADLGNTVYVIGHNEEKIKKLKGGDPIIYEPGLAELLKKNLDAKRIFFSTQYAPAITNSDAVFIAVGTPAKESGEADLTSVLAVSKKIGLHLKKGYTVVSCKSTVPVGTNRKIYDIIKKIKPNHAKFDIVSCPEFLREGSAINDTFEPDRIVIGSDSKEAAEIILKIHKPLNGSRVVVSIESAELIKYISNSILATKISFANLVSFLCEKIGADVEDVLNAVGLDQRIGRAFFYPGVGYGGSCFPKDVKALINTGNSLGVDMSLLTSTEEINYQARFKFLNKIIKHCSQKNIGIWGLSFKPNTDDVRDAPSIFILDKLLEKGFKIKVYDPEATVNIKKIFKEKISYAKTPFEAAREVQAIVILTEWNEFKQISLQKVKLLMNKPVIIDGRNIYSVNTMKKLGFTYISIGR